MNTYIKLLSNKFKIEQQIRDLHNLHESKQQVRESLLPRLTAMLEYVNNQLVLEAVKAFGPGEDSTSPDAETSTATDTSQPAAAGTQPKPAAPGQTSPTPPAGGSTPTATSDGMVKMAKLDQNKKPLGTPIMVKPPEIASKQKQGFFVIGEDASAGASSAGGIASSPTGFASGGIGMQRRKKKKVGEANKGISTATDRAHIASRFSHDPDRAATMYKANKYDPKTGLGGYIAPRGDTTDQSNIILQLRKNLDVAKAQPIEFQDGTSLKIRPSIARAALNLLDGMRPVEKHQAIKAMMKSKDSFVAAMQNVKEGTMVDAEKESSGPKFTGYWKGTDKGKPGKKMVGSGT